MKHNIIQKQSWLQSIDKFGVGVSIRYNKQSFHKTSCGGFFTMAIIGFMIYNTVIIAYELILQNSPTVIQQTNYIQQQPSVTLNPNIFTIALGLQDENYVHFLDETIYTISARQNLQIREMDQSGNASFKLIYTDVKMKPCTAQNFQVEGTQQYFLNLPYQFMYCISQDQQFPSIEGEFSNDRFSQFELFFKKCQNTTESSKCKPQNVINQKLSKITLGTYISNYEIEITNKDKPFFSNGQNLFWSTGVGMEKDVYLQLMNNKIQSDSGIIFNDFNTIQNLSYSSNREIVLPQTTDLLFYMSVLYEKNKEQVFTRTYMKLNTAFSQVGGLFNFLIFLGYAICRPFSQLRLNQKVINELFTFGKKRKSPFQAKNLAGLSPIVDAKNLSSFSKRENYIKRNMKSCFKDEAAATQVNIPQNKENDETIAKFPISPLNQLNSNGKLTSINQINQSVIHNQPLQSQTGNQVVEDQTNPPLSYSGQLQQANQKVKTKPQSQNPLIIEQEQSVNQNSNLSKKQDKSLKINMWDYCLSYFRIFKCFQTQRQKIIQYSTDSILRHIDLFNIIRKLIELEKLKRLLLNENQRKLFEYLPKPNLCPNDFENCNSEEQFIEKSEEMQQVIGLLCDDYKESERVSSVEEAYKQIKYSQKNKSHLDERLIEMLDNSIKEKVDSNEYFNQLSKQIQEELKPQINTQISDVNYGKFNNNKTDQQQQVQGKDQIHSLKAASIYQNYGVDQINLFNQDNQNELESCTINLQENIPQNFQSLNLKSFYANTQIPLQIDLSPSKLNSASINPIPQSVKMQHNLSAKPKNASKIIKGDESQSVSMNNTSQSIIELNQIGFNIKNN
ncbi:transmembrane protein, putative (macronuclear) [Tetrahymena thermophila SB210]|uniref:Transmembrane protein, putative n=1 Tax=Tetrahymena thermophila (strain SB210) TaxID=312017 RepID=I7M7N3_TETTS|nr:transmembrane protein, putative [Tetrahymena thermophila SB210]EAR94966.2 transmembrane protein, putative [Tetrahymena thermophila SB210]|eukprot:XP_001015211.2 transmembrane protein, putative [Tetrahymena thermophila SB210]